MIDRFARAVRCTAALVLLSTPIQARDWDVRARGRVVFNDPNAGWRPIAGANIKVMDSDILIDDTLGEGWTDGNGNFNVPGRGGDAWLPLGVCDDNCTKPDVYVTVALRNDRAEVETEIGFTWHANTGVRN